MTIKDDGYISNYLIHWTGKESDENGAKILSIIASTCKLLLSYNRLHLLDINYEIQEKMVCFTDVPLAHSKQHCGQYGRFGIAFNKLRLMNVGAQPVFYASHACKRDMDVIFKFLQDQTKKTTIDQALFKALHRHFYYIQPFITHAMWTWCQARSLDIRHLAVQFVMAVPYQNAVIMPGPSTAEHVQDVFRMAETPIDPAIWRAFKTEFGVGLDV